MHDCIIQWDFSFLSLLHSPLCASTHRSRAVRGGLFWSLEIKNERKKRTRLFGVDSIGFNWFYVHSVSVSCSCYFGARQQPLPSPSLVRSAAFIALLCLYCVSKGERTLSNLNLMFLFALLWSFRKSQYLTGERWEIGCWRRRRRRHIHAMSTCCTTHEWELRIVERE